jgi:hypothetical protein
MSSIADLKYLTNQINRLFEMTSAIKSGSERVGGDLDELCKITLDALHEYDVALNRYWKKKAEEQIDEMNACRHLITNEAEFYSVCDLLELDTEIEWHIQFERLRTIRSDFDGIIEDYRDYED